MCDLRLAATTLALSVAVMSVSLAGSVNDKSSDPAMGKAQPVAESSSEARSIRVILPASWEPSKRQVESQSTR